MIASHDGGATVTSVAGSPATDLPGMAGDGSVYGIAPEGTPDASADRAVTWHRRGDTASPLQAQAISADPGGRLTVVTDTGVERFTDGGFTHVTATTQLR